MGLNRNLGNIPEVIKELNGNIGIGTITPDRKLTVNSDLPIRLEANSNSSGYYTLLGTNYDYDKSFLINNKGDEIFTYSQQETLGLSLSNPRAGNIRFSTNGSERMRIFSSGNVFIGVSPTDSGYKLDVNGTGRFNGTSASPVLYLSNTSGGTTTTFTVTENTGLIINSYESTSARSIDLRVGGTSALTISSSQAATFSSAVTNTSGMLLNVGATGTNANLNYTTFTNGIYSALNSATPTEGIGMWSDNLGNGMIGSLYNNNASSLNLVVRGSSSTNGFVALKLQGTGTATFTNAVTTKGTANYNGFIADNSSSATIGGGYFSAYSFGTQRAIFGVAGAISGTADNNVGIFGESGLGIKFFVNGSGTASHMMTSGGNFLIGTATDSGDKLNVNGSIKATAFNMAGNHNATISTNSVWSAFQTLIPTGTLLGYSTYLISVWWTHNGTGQPYEVACSFMHTPVNTNGGGVDSEFTPMMSTHTGGTGAIMTFRSRAGYGGASGIEVKFVNFSSVTGTIFVRATKMQGF